MLKKTWKEIQMECLGLLFSRTDGGNLVTLDHLDIQDYVNEMIDAANYALRDLADVARPIVKKAELVREAGEKAAHYNLRTLEDDFMRLIPNRIFREYEGQLTPYDGYMQEGPYMLYFPCNAAGRFWLYYCAYPQPVSKVTPDDETFELAAEALDLVPIYMASRLYKEDDIAIATGYLNEYHARREELIHTASDGVDNAGDMGGGFTSITGWC